jgi:hypothetical protein
MAAGKPFLRQAEDSALVDTRLLTLRLPIFEEFKPRFWKVITFVDANCSCWFYSAVFTGVLSPDSRSQLKERAL